MTAAPAIPARMPQEPAGEPRRLTGPLRAIRAINASTLTKKEKHVLHTLLGWISFDTWRVYASTTTVADGADMSYNGVARAFDALEQRGVLKILNGASGRRADLRELDIEALERMTKPPQTAGDDSPPEGPDDNRQAARAPTHGTHERGPKTPQPDVGSPNEPRKVPTGGTNQSEQRKAAAVARTGATPTPPSPESPRHGAAAETRQGSPRPEAHAEPARPLRPAQTAEAPAPIAAAGLPPLSPTNAPQGHVAGLAGTPWGAKLLAMLTDAGCRSGDAWLFARRADFDYDLVAYVLHRAKETKRKVHDGETESQTVFAGRLAGLIRLLAREPREGMNGWKGFQQHRIGARAHAIRQVWIWVQANNPPAEQQAAVAAWAERHDLLHAKPEEWARHLPVTDLDLYPARQGAAGAAKAWDSIVAGTTEQNR